MVEFSKKSYKMLEKQKYCKNTLLFQFEKKHFSCFTSLYIPKPEQKKTESRMNYDFFCTCKQKDCLTPFVASSVNVRVLISQQNEAFI